MKALCDKVGSKMGVSLQKLNSFRHFMLEYQGASCKSQ
jgi:hypothetical protein